MECQHENHGYHTINQKPNGEWRRCWNCQKKYFHFYDLEVQPALIRWPDFLNALLHGGKR